MGVRTAQSREPIERRVIVEAADLSSADTCVFPSVRPCLAYSDVVVCMVQGHRLKDVVSRAWRDENYRTYAVAVHLVPSSFRLFLFHLLEASFRLSVALLDSVLRAALCSVSVYWDHLFE